jgi:hypothetical protein
MLGLFIVLLIAFIIRVCFPDSFNSRTVLALLLMYVLFQVSVASLWW